MSTGARVEGVKVLDTIFDMPHADKEPRVTRACSTHDRELVTFLAVRCVQGKLRMNGS